MSASPQPPPPAPPVHRDEPAPLPNGDAPTPPAPTSTSQLAALLTKSLQEAEGLKSELASLKRRAEKAERLLATFQASQSPPSPPAQGSAAQGPPPKPHLSDAARKAIVDSENRADRAEQQRDEAEARLRMLQESWADFDRALAHLELRNSDVRAQFSRFVAEAGGPVVPIHTIYLPSALQQPGAGPAPQQPLPASSSSFSRSHPSGSRARAAGSSSQPFPSVALPPPPSASSSRVRPRAGSMDAAYNGVLSGPGAPPPAKRPRPDRDSDRARDRFSLSPSNSPAYVLNGTTADRSPPHAHHSNTLPAIYPRYQQHYSHRRSERDDAPAARYALGAPLEHAHHRRGRSTSRGRDHSSRSRSRSRASSLSLEEMLIEATTTPADERPGPDGHVRAMHPAAHLHPSAHHRSPSPGRAEYLAVPPRAYASAAVQPHASGYATDGGAQDAAQTVNGEQHTYQMHIFTPPVTGAPVKKNKSGGAGLAQTASANSSVLTLGPTGSVISGPTNLGGGYPPTNASGQRICRQCGQPGRYKEGKCVEKWGPGPEGPGTVCDRCRKKMKRVERRGTLDSQSLSAQLHHPPAAVHPSGAPQAAPNGRALHRSETMHIHPSSSAAASRLGPSGTHLLPSSSSSSPHSSSYVRHERDRAYDRTGPSTPHAHAHYAGNGNANGNGAGRSPPTPPAIATLPNSGTGDEEARYDGTPRSRGARVAGRDWHAHAHAHKASLAMAVNGHHTSGSGSGSGSSRSASRSPRAGALRGNGHGHGSPRGSDGKSKSSELMDVDADGEEVDAEGDEVDGEIDGEAEAEDADGDGEGEGEEGEGDADADAELLEAVDAAEAANATDEEWLKKEASEES